MSVYAIFASIGEHMPFKKKEKLGEANSEGAINLLHYRATVMLVMAFCLLVTSTELIAGMSKYHYQVRNYVFVLLIRLNSLNVRVKN
jgi:hypothetical protein